MLKYKLTENTIEKDGHILHQIEALIDIPEMNVKIGDLGGYVESETNLSQLGKCWVYLGAYVYDYSSIEDDSVVSTDSVVRKNSVVYGESRIMDSSKVINSTICNSIIENTTIEDNSIDYTFMQFGVAVRDLRIDCKIKKLVDEARELSKSERIQFLQELNRFGFYDEI